MRSGTSPGMGQPPPGGGQVQGQLQGAVSNALAAPSRYDLPEVQKVRDALTGQITQQFGASRKKLEEDLARRGLSASTIGGGYYGDLQGQEDTALAGMNAQLIQNQASTNAADLSASLGAGQNYVNSANSNNIAQQGLDLQGELGRGNLGVAQGQLGLGQQSLAQQGGQFQQTQGLAEKLGLGNLGLQQQSLNQSGSQFDRSLAQSGSQFDKSLAQSGSQFDRSQGLAEKLGLGGLGIQQGQLDLAREGQGIQSQQFKDQLAQALGIATMGDKTANRAVDANAALAQNDMMMKVMALLQQYGLGGTGGAGGGTGSGAGGGTQTDPNAKPDITSAVNEWKRQHPGQTPPPAASKEFSDWMTQNPQNTWGKTGPPTRTINYGGQQYTQEQWDAYRQTHPDAPSFTQSGGGSTLTPGASSYSRTSTGSTLPTNGFSGGQPTPGSRTPASGPALGASTGQGSAPTYANSTTGRPAQPPAGPSYSQAPSGGQANSTYSPPGGYSNIPGYVSPAAPSGFYDPLRAMQEASAAALKNGPQANGSQGTQYMDANNNPVSLEEGQRLTLADRTRDATDSANSFKNAGALFTDTMPAGQSMTGTDGKPVLPGGTLQDMIKTLLARYGGS